MLRLVLPKGSLERATLQLFEDADLAVVRSSDVDYRATIDDPRIDDVRILRPQEIPRYVADGLFDIGITGRDWIEETGAEVTTLEELHYSKATARPIKMVLAVASDASWKTVEDLPAGVRVHTEYPDLTRRFLEKHGVRAEVSLSYGATEAKIPEIADAVVEITETGRALRAAGLKILDTILVSYTELIANPIAFSDAEKRRAMEQLRTLLTGALEARPRAGEAQRRRNEPRLGDLVAARVEVTDGLEAVRRRRVRGRDGGGEIGDQHVDPRPQGRGSDRHHRAADLQDRPVTIREGKVVSFDAPRGLGVVVDDAGTDFPFHCTAIADGTRTIEPGTRVRFEVAPGLGRWEAAALEPRVAA